MHVLDLTALTLDLLLVGAAVLAYLARPRVGGEMARGLRVLMAGVIVLGLAHLVETGLFELMDLTARVNEVVHRGIVGAGFIMVIWGFAIMKRAFDR